jgi:hypothetical protein
MSEVLKAAEKPFSLRLLVSRRLSAAEATEDDAEEEEDVL